jgi:hypothetical protein
MRCGSALLALLMCAGVCGCAGAGGPARARGLDRPAGARGALRRATARSGGADASFLARADRTHEVPTPARPDTVTRVWAGAAAAVRAFAAAYVNWTASTVAARLRALARECVGQARATLQLQAGEVAADAELHRGRIINSGTVEAVGPLPGSSRRYAVVTRERTRAPADAAYRGLAPEWHVSVATVTRLGGGWVVSGWQPES